jgi:hypothetical protein
MSVEGCRGWPRTRGGTPGNHLATRSMRTWGSSARGPSASSRPSAGRSSWQVAEACLDQLQPIVRVSHRRVGGLWWRGWSDDRCNQHRDRHHHCGNNRCARDHLLHSKRIASVVAPHLAVRLLEPQLADAQHYQDTDDHEEAAEQDGRLDLKPFVKEMAHPGVAYRAGTRRDIQRWNRKSIPANGLGNTIWSMPNNVSPTPAKILSPSTPPYDRGMDSGSMRLVDGRPNLTRGQAASGLRPQRPGPPSARTSGTRDRVPRAPLLRGRANP